MVRRHPRRAVVVSHISSGFPSEGRGASWRTFLSSRFIFYVTSAVSIFVDRGRCFHTSKPHSSSSREKTQDPMSPYTESDYLNVGNPFPSAHVDLNELLFFALFPQVLFHAVVLPHQQLGARRSPSQSNILTTHIGILLGLPVRNRSLLRSLRLCRWQRPLAMPNRRTESPAPFSTKVRCPRRPGHRRRPLARYYESGSLALLSTSRALDHRLGAVAGNLAPVRRRIHL